MANPLLNEPQFENFNDLNKAVAHLVDLFTGKINPILQETVSALQFLANFDNNEDIIQSFEIHLPEIQNHIAQGSITISASFANFLQKFQELRRADGLKYITSQAIMCNTTKVFQNALFLLANNDGDEESKKTKQLVGVSMLKSLSRSERISKFIPHQKPQGEKDLDFPMLFISEVLPRLDVERGFSLKKVNVGNNRKFLSEVGLELEDISSKYVYFAYSYSKEYDLSSLLENLDNIPIELLVENQRKLIFFQKNVAEVDNFIARDKITQDMIDENPELEVFKLIPSESDLYISNMITTRNVQVAVNVALAVKLIRASADEGKPIGEIIEQLEENNIFIDFPALEKGIWELIDRNVEAELIGVDNGTLYQNCADLLVTVAFSKSLNYIDGISAGKSAKSRKRREGLPILVPYSLLRHIPGDGKVPEANLEFLPFVVSSFKDLLSTYPLMLEIGAEILKDKSQFFFNHGKLIEDREALVKHVLQFYIRGIHSYLEDLNITRNRNIEGKEIEEIKYLSTLLQEVSPGFYEFTENVLQQIINEVHELREVTNFYYKDPKQINRSVPTREIEAMDPLNITQKIREHGAKFNLKRRKKIRENIEDLGEES